MKTNQLEFKWDEQPEPTAKAAGEGIASLQDLRTPEESPKPPAEPIEENENPETLNGHPSRWTNYGPNHPWYYLPQGDNLPPVPVEQIPAAQGVGRFLEREVPKDPRKRTNKLRELLDIEHHDLSIDIERYQELADKGVAALSRYDREIAHGGNGELARASALALKFNHIAWGKGRVAWLEEQLGKPGSASTPGRSRQKRGEEAV